MIATTLDVIARFDGDIRVQTPFDVLRTRIADSPSPVVAIDDLPEPLSGLPLRMRLPSIRAEVTAAPRAWGVRCEAPGPFDEKLTLVLDQFGRAAPFIEGIAVRQVTVVLAAIEPYVLGDWAQLLQEFSDAFYLPGLISADAVDIGILFDTAGDGYKGQVKCGPMKKKQLVTDYVKLGHEDDYPELSVFLQYQSVSSPAADIGEAARSVLERASRHCDSYFQQFFDGRHR